MELTHMKNLLFITLIAMLAIGSKGEIKEVTNEKGFEAEAETIMSQEEWTVLFDGTSFDEWKGYLKDEVPDTWKLENGTMVFYPPKDRLKGESHNIVTKREYTNFVLSLEWKISVAGNSGIFWGIVEDEKYHQPYETGPEIQVLDNENHPDAKNGISHQAGSLYDMVAPSKDMTRPVGEWNTCVILVDHESKQGSVVLNGEEIVTFPVANELWNAMVSKSKFADWEGFGKFATGKIGLQDHGDIVAYRNIKIKEL